MNTQHSARCLLSEKKRGLEHEKRSLFSYFVFCFEHDRVYPKPDVHFSLVTVLFEAEMEKVIIG